MEPVRNIPSVTMVVDRNKSSTRMTCIRFIFIRSGIFTSCLIIKSIVGMTVIFPIGLTFFISSITTSDEIRSCLN